MSKRVVYWVFVTKSWFLCRGEAGNRVDRICMFKDSRKFECSPAVVYIAVLKLPLALFFFLLRLVRRFAICLVTNLGEFRP